MSEYSIWKQLRAAGLTAAGAAGLMGNMECESAMKANIAQRGMTSLSDEAYTAAADNGTIDFVYDAVGYGLCQWTFWSRKHTLLKFAKQRCKSVGDAEMQVNFCLYELGAEGEYASVNALLRSTDDIYAAADWVCRIYEKPAVNNVDARYNAAIQIFSRCSAMELRDSNAAAPGPEQETDPEDEVLALPVLKNGDHSEAVRSMQHLLTKRGYSVGFAGVDSWFGEKTEQALRRWQGDNELPVDGVCKAKDWYFLVVG